MEKVKEVVTYKPASPVKSAWWGQDTGRFNLCSNKQDFQLFVRLNFEDGTHAGISELWPVDSAPDVSDHTDIMDVVELISERLETYWISTGRDVTRGKIAWIKENRHPIAAAWLTVKVDAAKKKLVSAQDVLKRFEYQLEEEQTKAKMRVYMNGDQWCAVMPDFVDLQASPAGFGGTPDEARQNLFELTC